MGTLPFENLRVISWILNCLTFTQFIQKEVLENENLTICVYRHNSIPFVMEFGSDIFIQREEIEGNRHYKGNNIYVGNNITTQISCGNVTITSGSNVNIQGQKVVLSAGTRVERGAKLNIINRII